MDWFAARLPRDRGPVFEAMSGSGRLLVPLAQRGFSVHGADSSDAMLASCEARLRACDLEPRVYRQDIASLNLPFRYQAAFVAGGSFQLLADPLAARLALERLRVHLLPGGTLLLDLFIPEAGTHPPGANEVEVRAVKLDDGTRITLRSEVEVNAQARLIDWRNRYERRAPGSVTVEREDETLEPSWRGDADEGSFAAVAHAGNG